MNQSNSFVGYVIFAIISAMLIAIAVPACKQQTANSGDGGVSAFERKNIESEAITNLKAIADGAIAYFEAEHYDDTGMHAYTRVYPHCGASFSDGKWTFTGCKSGQSPIGKPASKDTVGSVFKPADYSAAFNASPWKDLYFMMSRDFRYYYDYVSSDGGDGSSSFAVKASASISAECDSIFTIHIDSNGNLPPIQKESDKSKCNAAILP